MQLKSLIKEFIYECTVRRYTPATIKGYRNRLLYLQGYLEKMSITDIEDITPSIIKDFLSWLQANECKEVYINSFIKVLNSFYKFLIMEDYVSKNINPMTRIRFLKEDATLIQTFTDNEVKKMLTIYTGGSYLDVRNRAIVAMLFDTGIRNFELCNLKAEWVKDNYIIIFGKGNKERIVPKSPYLSKILFKYDRQRDKFVSKWNTPTNHYFLSRSGKPLTTAVPERIITQAGIEANVRKDIRCSPHTCRHYFAQKQLLTGNDVHSVQRLLGHCNVAITNIYLKSMKDESIIEKSMQFSPLMNL